MNDLKDVFESIISKQETLVKKNNCLFDRMGYVKILLAITFSVIVYYMFTQWDTPIFKIATTILFIIQIGAWIYQAKLGQRIAHSKGIIEINHRHLARLSGQWTEFPDLGNEFIDPEHPYGCDLDIVGRKSLFQFLNTTHTWHGRQAFAHDLLHATYSSDKIRERQEAIAELAQDNEFASELEYRFSKIGNDPAAHTLVQELKDDRPFIKNRIFRAILTYLPSLVTLFVGLSVFFRWEQFYVPSILLLISQTILWLLGLPVILRYIQSVDRLPFKLNAYVEVLTLVENRKFSSHELQQIQCNLTILDISATQAIKELVKITNWVSVRANPLVHFILNVLFLWDYICAFRFEKWKAKYAPHCETWFVSLGILESLLSLATMKKVCSQTCFPAISDSRGVEATELGHPLLSNASRVTNPLKLNDAIVIISGSNMSGKTTYLRTVGINIVLARAGAPVCAKEMVCSDLQIITSMRITDDLNEGISTFYAELKRIKRILDSSESDQNTLFLIDEIFRGTNSVDRMSGAKTVITKLSKLNTLGMVTTHDLELCDLQQTVPRIQNYSFSESYEDKKLCFDYKIRPGKSQTTNAKYLMELIGITE